ncbi:MAG: hypothetical protein GY926_21320 [bacterium]|nr:hypothetical protein [bacterium]
MVQSDYTGPTVILDAQFVGGSVLIGDFEAPTCAASDALSGGCWFVFGHGDGPGGGSGWPGLHGHWSGSGEQLPVASVAVAVCLVDAALRLEADLLITLTTQLLQG